MTRVKICGITNREDALAAAEAGADALGFVFAPSARRIEPSAAAAICRALPPFVARVGVFVDEAVEGIRAIARTCGLTAIQLHGAEPPCYAEELAEWQVLRAVRLRNEESLAELERWRCAGFVLDAYVEGLPGGTGQTARWDIAREAAHRGHRVILAGGLTPGNVADAIVAVRPYGVDASSGLEREPGRKDPPRIAQFLHAVRHASVHGTVHEGGNG